MLAHISPTWQSKTPSARGFANERWNSACCFACEWTAHRHLQSAPIAQQDKKIRGSREYISLRIPAKPACAHSPEPSKVALLESFSDDSTGPVSSSVESAASERFFPCFGGRLRGWCLCFFCYSHDQRTGLELVLLDLFRCSQFCSRGRRNLKVFL